MKVLVVDDERDVQMLFEQKFRAERRTGEFEFYFAFSAEEALLLLGKNGISELVLILSDINMPGINGIQLLKIIKEKHPEIKVFMITAYGDDDNYQSAMQNGADGFLTKPLDFDDLKTRMKSLKKNE